MGVHKKLDGMTLEDMAQVERPTVKALAEYFLSGKTGDIYDLVNHIGLTLDGLSGAVRDMRRAGVVRICDWVPPDAKTGRTHPRGVYAAGSEPDAPKPKPKTYNKPGRSAQQRERYAQLEKELEEKRELTKEVGDVIKPRLTPEQAYETNRRYWNWISGGAYG